MIYRVNRSVLHLLKCYSFDCEYLHVYSTRVVCRLLSDTHLDSKKATVSSPRIGGWCDGLLRTPKGNSSKIQGTCIPEDKNKSETYWVLVVS